MAETTYEDKCQILSELWMEYRDDEDFEDFVNYNDLGLPLAYSITHGIVESNGIAAGFINETFRLLLVGLEIKEDPGFETFEDVLDYAKSVESELDE